jgi:RIO kinase 1
MIDPLAPLLADGVIDEVVSRLKSGKEADLWLVRHGAEIVAAKVYKAPHARSFKNNAGYKEGRQVRDTRTQRAMNRGSRFGKAAAEEAWKTKEADALHALHAAGVRVPRPVMYFEGVLLMELVVDAHGHPAPRLIDAQVTRDQAAALYADLRGQAVRMLCCDLIHGDLSPYNVLLGRDGAVVIDLPQVVGAAHNSQAERYFQRDVENLREFFAGIDPALRASAGDAREIWQAYVRRELTPGFVPTGRLAPMPARGGRGASQPEPRHHPPQRPGEQRHERSRGHGERGREAGDPARRAHGEHGRGDRQEQRPPHGRRPDRRREAPAPEVIRVTRPPLAGQERPPAQAPRPPGVATSPVANASAGGAPGRRRRRRRRPHNPSR